MTHLFELFVLMTSKIENSDIEVDNIHYTADGLTAVISDIYDDQKYRITIVPEGETK